MGWKQVFALVLFAVFSLPVSATTIVIQNNDAAGEGFNDPTDAASIPNQRGDNPGATLGEMRMELFKAVAGVWENLLNSNVTITVGASFDALGCSEDGATLGSASATSTHAGFTGSKPGVAYNVALAESIKRSQLNDTEVEIIAIFNSDIDADDNCLGSGGFYYGLDGNTPGESVPLFTAVLHEMAHGLGFTSFSDIGPEGSGAFTGAGGFPDSYSLNLFDLDAGKSWGEMSNQERKASALNAPALVWEGAKTSEDRGLHLDPELTVTINAPESISGEFAAVLGEETTIVIPPDGVTRSVLDGNTYDDLDSNPDPADGCTQIRYGGTFRDKIVLFDAADCGLYQGFYSQVESAVGTIIAATTETGFPDVSGKYGNSVVTIPYVGVEKPVGDALRANIDKAIATIGYSSSMFRGDNQGMLQMFAPADFYPDVSVSHWGLTAVPALLMQPRLGLLEHADVDITAAAMRDIGWSVNIPGEPPNLVFEDGFED